MTIRVYCYSGQVSEQQRLRHLAARWDFWSYEETSGLLMMDGYYLFYATNRLKRAPWRGVLLAQITGEEAEILYIYTIPKDRCSGVASALMMALTEQLKNAGPRRKICLEVRQDNVAGIQFYENKGMELVGQRKKYYKDGQTALVYRKVL